VCLHLLPITKGPSPIVARLSTSCNNDACDVTLSVYPHRASLKNMPVHGGNRTYDLWRHIFKLARCGYALRVTSQASYSPEYITLTQLLQGCHSQRVELHAE
jgi:hypothetical protein